MPETTESANGMTLPTGASPTPSKPWQRGYDRDMLRRIEDRFADHNAYSASPFSEMNGPKIAQGLHSGTLKLFDWGAVDVQIARSDTPIKMYLDVVIANKHVGDRVVNAFCYWDRRKLMHYLSAFETPTWLWVWQESDDMTSIAEDCGYTFVGSKISSFGEIRGLWFKDGDSEELFPRKHPQLNPAEYLGLKQADLLINTELLCDAVDEVKALDISYTNHYSNYNKKRSWSALSLRGYTDDPAFIIKPVEMNKKWHAEHAGETFELQDTPLRKQLPAVEALHRPLTRLATSVHRIRLMKLAPGGGELKRHTDLVDKDTGVADSHLARFHFPLVTNQDVVFGSWDVRGHKREVNMRVGEAWYLDTRKPHTAINGGDTERIHLVIDVESNAAIRRLLL